MDIYVISDLHLGFGCGKTMDRFGPGWERHAEKIRDGCARITDDDILVIPGDVSWGNNMSSAEPDLEWIIGNLSGRKVLIRGNHDRFWAASHTEALNERFSESGLFFLHKNFYPAGEYAVVGTKGYLPESGETIEQARKLYGKETERLTASFEAAREAGYDRFLCFMHYPPTMPGEARSVFTDIVEQYGAEVYCYGHLHGEEYYHESLIGERGGVKYMLVSSDYLGFTPIKIS